MDARIVDHIGNLAIIACNLFPHRETMRFLCGQSPRVTIDPRLRQSSLSTYKPPICPLCLPELEWLKGMYCLTTALRRRARLFIPSN